MTAYHYAQTLANRVREDMAALRQAERDAAQYCGMAFDADSAAETYRAALDHLGVSRRETAGLSASALRVILKNVRPGSHASRGGPTLAMDVAEGSSALSSILGNITRPKDISTRSDRLR